MPRRVKASGTRRDGQPSAAFQAYFSAGLGFEGDRFRAPIRDLATAARPVTEAVPIYR
jgi:hypothetical protein